MVNLRHQLREEVPEGQFEILAFPCRQFADQEFHSADKIKEFVKQFSVDFPMFDTVEVNGNNAHPIFQFLKYYSPELRSEKKSGSQSKVSLGAIGWNFGKFLVDGEGHVVKYWGPKVNPLETKETCLKVLKGELKGAMPDRPKEINLVTE